MRKFGFDNEYGTSFDYGIHFLSFPVFQYGQEVVNDIEVSNRAGTLTERTGTYSNTVITNELEFDCSCLAEYENKMQEIRRWLKKTRKVTYTDAEEKYFAVKKIEIDEEARLYGVFGNITVIFTCSPSTFFHDGDSEINILSGDSIYNAFSVAHPIYRISGEGMCTLIVNGKSIKANIGQNLTIDTDLMIAYREDGTLINTSIAGNYEDIYLQEGNNSIAFSAGFTVKLVPKWRVLT
ncbi:hypothetical protein [Muricomes intestini]|jgi:phage-related protein|uniref:hypothetical protein n=1 Tax=Muricomes intestini TaxID=1796634 RepID=UPI0026B7186A